MSVDIILLIFPVKLVPLPSSTFPSLSFDSDESFGGSCEVDETAVVLSAVDCVSASSVASLLVPSRSSLPPPTDSGALGGAEAASLGLAEVSVRSAFKRMRKACSKINCVSTA